MLLKETELVISKDSGRSSGAKKQKTTVTNAKKGDSAKGTDMQCVLVVMIQHKLDFMIYVKSVLRYFLTLCSECGLYRDYSTMRAVFGTEDIQRR